VVTVDARALATVIGCVERCHVGVKGLTSTTYAAAVATLTEEEAMRGCLVLDMGGGATGIAFVSAGRLALVDQIPYGGDLVTNDLAYGLATSSAHAERLKSLYGGVLARYGDDDERILVPQVNDPADRPSGEVPRSRITHIVRPRIEETLEMVQDRLAAAVELFRSMQPRSIVLTGGSSQIEGLEELAQEVFHLPARLGRPNVVSSRRGTEEEPCCSAVSGALALARGDDGGMRWRERQPMPVLSQKLSRIGHWLRQNF
jgi:cell division protein FtsA